MITACGDLKSVKSPECIYYESLYQISNHRTVSFTCCVIRMNIGGWRVCSIYMTALCTIHLRLRRRGLWSNTSPASQPRVLATSLASADLRRISNQLINISAKYSQIISSLLSHLYPSSFDRLFHFILFQIILLFLGISQISFWKQILSPSPKLLEPQYLIILLEF